ncbi:MAG: sigma-70 family RNA polymerase sigma factor [Defluviitaleaceae bacterium]|nr:sigma-70 family RNA polymerase sigma factor [Defluviitaleaceae bacterium]
MPEISNEELCILAVNGDIPSRDLLWQRTERLFRYIAYHLYCRHRERADASGVESDDCSSVCWFAFLDTVKAFSQKTEQEYTFTSFAKLHIRKHIYDLLGCRSKREPLNTASPLDTPLSPDDGTMTLVETVVCPDAEQPFADVDEAGLEQYVLERVALLPERQQAIIHRHFWDSAPFTHIAADFGCTPQNVRATYKQALSKLRKDEEIQKIHSEFYADYNFYRRTGFQGFREDNMSAVERALLYLEGKTERLSYTVQNN